LSQPFIELKNIVKQFGSHLVLNGINLNIFKGETLAIIGKSGTGKSVLLKHIIGLLKQDAGQILVNGIDMDTMSAQKKRAFQKNLSYMFQDNALFDSMTIYENIALPLTENHAVDKKTIPERVRHKMDLLGLSGIEKQFPSQLSGGMKKRVALARALITDPDVVLFDEPTTGLDPIRKKNVYNMIKEYQRRFGFTAVIVSHDIPQIFYISQRVAMIDSGKIRFSGPREDVIRSHNDFLNAFMTGQEPFDDVKKTRINHG
jgi:phospholipid/cholesterol/gamma-HCH transport system ATP-binding protein